MGNLGIMNTPLPVGRPTKYTDAQADAICHRMSEGENLNPILRSLEITRASFTRWVDANYVHADGEGFRIKYTRARKQYIDYMLDHVLEIPYDSSEDVLEDADGKRHGNHAKVQRDRLKVDTIKWVACKVVPKMPSLQGTLGEIARNIVRGVEKEGLPTEQAEKMMRLLEAAANIKKIDEFEDAIKAIPLLKSKLSEFERLRDEQASGGI